MYRIYCNQCGHDYTVLDLEFLDVCPMCEEEHTTITGYNGDMECDGFEYEKYEEIDMVKSL